MLMVRSEMKKRSADALTQIPYILNGSHLLADNYFGKVTSSSIYREHSVVYCTIFSLPIL